jgi:hypothetical protein
MASIAPVVLQQDCSGQASMLQDVSVSREHTKCDIRCFFSETYTGLNILSFASTICDSCAILCGFEQFPITLDIFLCEHI